MAANLSLEMMSFLESEIINMDSISQEREATLDDAHCSLVQMPNDILAEIVDVDEDGYDFEAFTDEFNKLLAEYGSDELLINLVE